MHDLYLIPNTSNKDREQTHGKEYNDPNYYPEFQNKLQFILNTIKNNFDNEIPYVILRVYDGEFLFLQKQVGGNGPRRHYSKQLTDDFVKPFKDGCYKVDLISVQLNIGMEQKYNNIFPDRPMEFPMDIIYGLVANRWLFKTFKNNITLIGGHEKMRVINDLMKYDEYKEYIGNDYFCDYISVPERHSCDNVQALVEDIGPQIANSRAKLFLFGIGISKMAIAWQFKNYKNAVFVDIGCGMSALAGACSTNRPYFGSWINYRLKNYNYGSMDPMDFNINNDNVKVLN